MAYRSWSKMLLAAVLITVISRGSSSAKDYQTYVVDPPINNNAILDGEALPIECRSTTVMKVLCTRGEYEPASFLVETRKPLEQVMVKIGPLKGTAGVLGPKTVDVRIAQKIAKAITWHLDTLPWVLVHDPGMITVVNRHPKWILGVKSKTVGPADNPIPLADYQATHFKVNQLNRPLIDTEELQPGNIKGRRQFWLTVHVPDDAVSGIYRAKVSISAKNSATTHLTLEVTVPSFDLLPPKFEYSIYYPAMLLDDTITEAAIDKYHPLTKRLYLTEMRNLVEHGCTNPNIYAGAELDKNGKLHFTKLSRILDLREKAGMGPGGPLYLFDGGGVIMKTVALTEKEKTSSANATRKIVAWARERGYSDVYFMGADEASADRLRGERDSFEAIHKGGGKIFVACYNDSFNIVGDLLDCAVLNHPGAAIVDAHQQWGGPSREWLLHRQRMVTWNPELLLTPSIQRIIKGIHKNGFKTFVYMDPQGGQPLPESHRRNRGLGMWKTGIDGTMTWAYSHIWTKAVQFGDQDIKDNGVTLGANSFILRGPEGPFDTLAWEGFREGRDDARYLATLQNALAKAKTAGKHSTLVARTERWLGDITVSTDLKAWRMEMVKRTEALLAL